MGNNKDDNDSDKEKTKIRTRSKKIHVEISPANWKNIISSLDMYNNDPGRVTPAKKADHLINEALDRYLSELEKKRR